MLRLLSFPAKCSSCTLNTVVSHVLTCGRPKIHLSKRAPESNTFGECCVPSTIWGFAVYSRIFHLVTTPMGKESAALSLSQYFPNLFDHETFFLIECFLRVYKLLQGTQVGYTTVQGTHSLINLKMQLMSISQTF